MKTKKILLLAAIAGFFIVAFVSLKNSGNDNPSKINAKQNPNSFAPNNDDAYNGVKRDIFAFSRRQERKDKTDKSSVSKKDSQKPSQSLNPPQILQEAVVNTPAPPPVDEKTPLQIFTSDLKYLGYLGENEARKIFLMKGADIFVVKKGTRIGDFLVTDLILNEIKIKDEKSNEVISIRY